MPEEPKPVVAPETPPPKPPETPPVEKPVIQPKPPPSAPEVVAAKEAQRIRELETKSSELERTLQETRQQLTDVQTSLARLGGVPSPNPDATGKTLLDEINEAMGL